MRFGGARTLPVLALIIIGATAGGQAAGVSTVVVHVDLMDPSSGPSVESMIIKTDQQSIKAGPVRFVVSNDSKDLVHELIVVSVADPSTPLPYDSKANRVIESKIKDLGEAADLKPGEKKTLSLTLKPGEYILMCNQPNHYESGMKTHLTVTR